MEFIYFGLVLCILVSLFYYVFIKDSNKGIIHHKYMARVVPYTNTSYCIEYSIDNGQTWKIVKHYHPPHYQYGTIAIMFNDEQEAQQAIADNFSTYSKLCDFKQDQNMKYRAYVRQRNQYFADNGKNLSI